MYRPRKTKCMALRILQVMSCETKCNGLQNHFTRVRLQSAHGILFEQASGLVIESEQNHSGLENKQESG